MVARDTARSGGGFARHTRRSHETAAIASPGEDKARCGRRSDMWSFGALVVRMVLKRKPFELLLTEDEDQAARQIQVGG